MALDRWMKQLYVRHRHRRLAVVAHSMGRLITRAFINRVVAAGDGRAVGLRLFVSVSTPWDGSELAQLAVDRSPVVAPSWYDVAPRSPFLRSLLIRSCRRRSPTTSSTAMRGTRASCTASRTMARLPSRANSFHAGWRVPASCAASPSRTLRSWTTPACAQLVNERLESVVAE